MFYVRLRWRYTGVDWTRQPGNIYVNWPLLLHYCAATTVPLPATLLCTALQTPFTASEVQDYLEPTEPCFALLQRQTLSGP